MQSQKSQFISPSLLRWFTLACASLLIATTVLVASNLRELPHEVTAQDEDATKATRLLADFAKPGVEIVVTLEVKGIPDGNLAQLVETLPDGFIYLSNSLPASFTRLQDRQMVAFVFDKDITFTYNVKTALDPGNYEFKGRLSGGGVAPPNDVIAGNASISIGETPPETPMPADQATAIPTVEPTVTPIEEPTAAPPELAATPDTALTPESSPTPMPDGTEPTSTPETTPPSMPIETPTTEAAAVPEASETPVLEEPPTPATTPESTTGPEPIDTATPGQPETTPSIEPADATPIADQTDAATATIEPNAAPEDTATPRPEPTATSEPTATHTPEPSATPQPTPTSTPNPTSTPVPTQPADTPTPEPTATDTPEPTATHTAEPTVTSTPAPTATSLPSPTPTLVPTATSTSIPTVAPTSTALVPTPTPQTTPDDSSAGNTSIVSILIWSGVLAILILGLLFFLLARRVSRWGM